jgi:UDP-N-acetylglucosamine:LPS N-acetylglucosamine transferase
MRSSCLSGLIVIGDASSLGETSGALSAFQIPVIAVQLPTTHNNEHEQRRPAAAAAQAGAGEILDKYDNLLTTMPDVTEQIRVRAERREESTRQISANETQSDYTKSASRRAQHFL